MGYENYLVQIITEYTCSLSNKLTVLMCQFNNTKNIRWNDLCLLCYDFRYWRNIAIISWCTRTEWSSRLDLFLVMEESLEHWRVELATVFSIWLFRTSFETGFRSLFWAAICCIHILEKRMEFLTFEKRKIRFSVEKHLSYFSCFPLLLVISRCHW